MIQLWLTGWSRGPLRMTDVTVPAELEERIRAVLPKSLPPEVVCTLIAYYAVNKPEDSAWVVLPVASFDAYFGTTSFGRKYLRLIPGEILERPDSGFGITLDSTSGSAGIGYGKSIGFEERLPAKARPGTLL